MAPGQGCQRRCHREHATSAGTGQQEIRTAARVAGFVEQQVEGQRRQIVGDGVDLRILLLIDDLQIAVAAVAGLRAHGPVLVFDLLVGDTGLVAAGGAGGARRF